MPADMPPDQTIADRLRSIEEQFGVTASSSANSPVPMLSAPLPPLEIGTTTRLLSTSQRRLWIVQHVDDNPAEYVIPLVLRLTGEVDGCVLSDALRRLVERHDSLRTAFQEEGEGVVRAVLDSATPELAHASLGTVSDTEVPKVLSSVVADLIGDGFDLTAAPLFRACLVQRSEQEHFLVLLMHHIICDGWSVDVIRNDLASIYGALVRGEEPPMLPLGATYGDFVAWQERHLDATEINRLLAHWTSVLHELPQCELPAQKRRPPVRTSRGAKHTFALSPTDSARLRAVAGTFGATAYMFLATIFAGVLRRFGAGDDIVLGTTVAGRHHEELENAVGLFANTSLLRFPLEHGLPVAGAVARVRDAVLDMQANSEMPFDLLVKKFGPVRDPSRTPLYQLMFEFQASIGVDDPDHPLGFDDVPVDGGTAKCDLALWMTERRGALHGEITYSEDLFDEWFVDSIAENLVVALRRAACENLRELDLADLVSREAEQSGAWWNNTDVPLGDTGDTLHELFERSVTLDPGAPAVIHDGAATSYGELNAVANALALHLRRHGAGAESAVVVCCDRGPAFVASVLGALKAGSGYVPLDVSFPVGRLGFMIADSGARWVLTESRWRSLVNEALSYAGVDGVTVIESDTVTGQDHGPDQVAVPENLAYIMYTSGSTGTPKGVAVDHRGVVNYLRWMQRHFDIDARDRTLQYAAVGFDISVWEIFLALLSGAAVVLPSAEQHRDASALAGLIEREGVTIAHFVPSLLRALLAGITPGRCPSLRHILCSAEPLTPQVRQACYTTFSARLWNIYGATEVSVDSTAYDCTGPSEEMFVPVGRPIDNTRIFVLDADGRTVPAGVPGQVLISGVSVTRGYLNRARLTAERFLPDPFAGTPGARMYCTGDLGRLLPDGNLDFLGRNDHQIKIRGHRVETAEIELILQQHPHVAISLVTPHTTTAGITQLVAYYTGTPTEPAILNQHLIPHLPDYMIPAHYLHVDAFPLNPNGKVHRDALPPPSPTSSTSTPHPPTTPIEQALATIWSDLLNQPTINTTDNFFELGGDSIVAIRLVSRAAEQGIRIRPTDIFRLPILGSLAAASAPVVPVDVPPPTQDQSGDVPLLPMQRAFLDGSPRHPGHYNLVAAMPVDRETDPAVLRVALDAVVRHHEALRIRLHQSDRGWTQTIAPAETGDHLVVCDLSHLPSHEGVAAWRAAVNGVHCGFDLTRGPLFTGLLTRYADRAELTLVVHHLAADIVSLDILRDDLSAAIRQLSQGDAVVLPPVAVPLSRWARRLAEPGRDRPQTPCEPVRYTLSDRRQTTTKLTETETEALVREGARAYRIRPHEILLAALSLAYAQRNPHEALTVDVEGHGRDNERFPEADLSRTVGWLADMYPVVLDPVGELPQAEDAGLLHRVLCAAKERHRAATSAGRPAVSPTSGADLILEYLGRLDSGPDTNRCASDTPLMSALSVEAAIVQGRMTVHWLYVPAEIDAAHVGELAEALLAWLRRIARHCAASAPRLTPADVTGSSLDQAKLDLLTTWFPGIADVYPLTPMQNGMLFHSLYAPDSTAYHEQASFRVRGALDPDRLLDAWRRVIARHTALRSTIVWEGLGEAVQVVHTSLEPKLTILEDTADVDAYLAADRADRLDLSNGPLHRLAIFSEGAGGYRLVWTFPHQLVDGWSVSLVMRELVAEYDFAYRGPQTLPFARFVDWLERQDHASARDYWQQVLGDVIEPTMIATREGDIGDGDQQGAVEFSIGNDASRAVYDYARANGLTVASVLVGAWAIVLGRYLDRPDVTFGVTLSGRPPELAEAENTVGTFIATLPLRISMNDAEPVPRWLHAVQRRYAELREFEYSSLMDAQASSGIGRGGTLFDNFVVVTNYPPAGDAPDRSLQVESLGAQERTGYPLQVQFDPEERIRILIRYQPGAFDDWVVRHLLDMVADVIGQLCRALDSPIGALRNLAKAGPSEIRDRSGRPKPYGSIGELYLDGSRTGDVARMRPDGLVEVLGPADLLLTEDGYPVLPNQIEAALLGHSGKPSDSADAGAAPADYEPLLAVIRETLHIGPVGLDDDFFRLGGDSITAIQVVVRARAAGIVLQPRDIFDNPTIRRLAAVVAGRRGSVAPANEPDAAYEGVSLDAHELNAIEEHLGFADTQEGN